ncbi:hypothetical protein HUT06_18995 [Actinomadura sp. NAK00032]|uniref:hypothetical protein n=1 Tax=Actinomadura sp. NAK00032 TaxID=2742128 RepID=UPI001592943F|nr:hypothetical protein [Actinomadura sp. NAK00032]QKW35866.1 hypothetical protein HUT06_18995 [Actinomadura sp. NAK00032]
MSGTAPRSRHGTAGLLVALFVVAGLVFSYGLGGHGPPLRVCTEHAVTVPVGTAAASGDAVHAAAALSAPDKAPALPLDLCLCVAVLFTLLLLALAVGLRRPLSRLPARNGWSLAPPPGTAPSALFPPVLQVLRL